MINKQVNFLTVKNVARLLLCSAIFFCSGFLFFSVNIIGSASAQAPITPVKTERVLSAPVIRKLELSGTVTAPRVSQISTSVEGLVKKVYFDSGTKIETGTILLDLDSEVEQAAFKQAQAQMRQAVAELADAERRLRIAQNLAKRAAGTTNSVDARKAEVAIDSAALERFKAELDRRAAILERHQLKAPFSGVITRKMVEAGQWVSLGTAVFELVSMENLRIDVPVPQDYYSQLDKSAKITAAFDSLPGKMVQARIGALIPKSDPNSRTFILRVLPERKQLSITPGMSAKVIVNIKTGGHGVVVSRDALIRYPDGRVTVWIVEENGKTQIVKERLIKIGIGFDGVVQVLSGLKEGERVVVRGNETLREGQSVRPTS